MQVIPLPIPDVLLLEPARFEDTRGFFSEVFSRHAFDAAGITQDFVQDNHSLSRQVGVLRGLHFQVPPHAQGKLVRVPRGRILDVAVDLRRSSATFGQHVVAELSCANWRQMWIPAGFAHGFVTLEPDTEVLYKVTEPYAPDYDRGLAWDDPALGIDWLLAPGEAVLSDKDRHNPRLAAMPIWFP